MKLVTLAILLVASFAFAQPSVTRGGALKKRAYQTYAAATYYVDPTGSDSNACTASGTSACLTLQSVLNRLPLNIKHAVTINVAAGTYPESPLVPPYTFTTTGSLTITGTRTTPTLVSGTTSGTLTSASNHPTASAGAALIIDTAQTWTVDDLSGRFVEITSGASSGTICPIASNTATTLSTTCLWGTPPGVGTTYAIRTPGSVFTGPFTIGGLRSSTTTCLTMNDVEVSSTSANVISNNTCLVALNRTKFDSTGQALSFGATRFTASYAVFRGAGGTTVITVGSGYPTWALTRVFVHARGSGQGLYVNPSTSSQLTGIFRTASTTSPLIYTTGSMGFQTGYNYPPIFVCDGAGTAYWRGTTSVFPAWGEQALFAPRVEGCAIGLRVDSAAAVLDVVAGPAYFINTTTAISVGRGATVDLNGNTMNFSGVTNELQLDGENFTYSFLNGLTPGVLSNAYGSTIIK